MRAEPTKTTRWVTPTQEQRGAMRRAERIARGKAISSSVRSSLFGALGWVSVMVSFLARLRGNCFSWIRRLLKRRK